MKGPATLLLLLCSFFVLQSSSCKHSNDDSVSPGGNNSPIAGQWYISYYWDNDKEESSDFSGYTFSFQPGGILTATRGSSSASGTWRETVDDGKPRFIINLSSSNEKLQDLNDDWILLSKTENEIKLKDDNTSKVEELHFSRQ